MTDGEHVSSPDERSKNRLGGVEVQDAHRPWPAKTKTNTNTKTDGKYKDKYEHKDG